MKRLMTLFLAASVAILMLAPTVLAGTNSGTVYWDRTTCLGPEDNLRAGTVTFTRDGKWLDGSVYVNGVADGTYGMLVFVVNAGTCPQGNGVFVGQLTVAAGEGSANLNAIKILGNRGGLDVTVVLCIGGNSLAPGVHFSQPVTLSP